LGVQCCLGHVKYYLKEALNVSLCIGFRIEGKG
jgi:hypothetical protein